MFRFGIEGQTLHNYDFQSHFLYKKSVESQELWKLTLGKTFLTANLDYYRLLFWSTNQTTNFENTKGLPWIFTKFLTNPIDKKDLALIITFSHVFFLLQNKHVMIEELLQFLVAEIDT